MSERFKMALLIIRDVASLYFSLFLTIFIWSGFSIVEKNFMVHLLPFTLIFSDWILIYFIEGLYSVRSQSPSKVVAYVARSTGINVILSFIFFYIFPNFIINAKTNLILIGFSVLIIISIRIRFLLKFFSWARFKVKIHTICRVQSNKGLESVLSQRPHLGYEIDRTFSLQEIQKLGVDIHRLLKNKIKMIVVDRNALRDNEILNKVFKVLSHNIKVMDLSNFTERITGKIPLDGIEKSWFLGHCSCSQSRLYDLYYIKNKSIWMDITIILKTIKTALTGVGY
jgi:hypothetical protein